jgi:hypothetical protein
VPSDFESQEVKTKTQADRLEREAEDEAAVLKAKAHAKAEQAKKKAQSGGRKIKANADNPVVLANAVLSVALFGGLGYGAYVKYRAGEFSWKVVGLGAAILGAFGVADFYVSQ